MGLYGTLGKENFHENIDALDYAEQLVDQPEFNLPSSSKFVVLLTLRGRYKRPLASRDFIGL